jgi:hypothetical protein
MKITWTTVVLLLSVFIIGCSRNYAVNRKMSSGDPVLVYTPDPDKDDTGMFKRPEIGRGGQ